MNWIDDSNLEVGTEIPISVFIAGLIAGNWGGGIDFLDNSGTAPGTSVVAERVNSD